MSAQVVIAAYYPRPGKEDVLQRSLKEHVPLLRTLGLVTDRPEIVLRASDGTYLEIFEWRSAEAVERAHGEEAVQNLWGKLAEVAEFKPLSSLAEAAKAFAHFEPV